MRTWILTAALLSATSSLAETTCVDLSGTWTGTCRQTPGLPFAYTTTFKQTGCTKKVEDDQVSALGAMNQKNVGSDRSVAIVSQNEWSADGQSLIWISTAQVFTAGTNQRFSEHGYGTYSIANGQFRLVSNYRSTKIVDGQFVTDTVDYDCTLDRVNPRATAAVSKSRIRPGMERY